LATRLERDSSGAAEVDPEAVWGTVRKAIHRLVSTVETGTAGKIDALGVSTIFGYVFLDGRDQPLGGATTWYDARATKECGELSRLLWGDDATDTGARRLARITGRRPSPEWLAPLLLWHSQNAPERLENMASVIGLKDEILRRLTGVLGTDFAHQDYSMLWDVHSGHPSEEIADALSGAGLLLRGPLLRDASPAQASAGTLLPAVALDLGLPPGIPVCRGSSDGTAAMYGAGVLRSDGAALVSGTTDVLMRFVPGAAAPADEGLSRNRGMEGGFLVGGATASSTRAVEVVCKLLGLKPHEAFAALAEEIAGESDAGALTAPTAGGRPRLVPPLVFPAFFGERAPFWDDRLAGSVVGLRPEHRPLDLFRGTLEGTGYRLKLLLEALGPVADVAVTGGAGEITPWNQIRADAMDTVLRQLAHPEATSIGTAMFCRSLLEGVSLSSLTEGLLEGAVDYFPRHAEYHRKRRQHFDTLAAVSRLEE
jgi:sugar (pentulose or hexulose) kinase